MLYSYASARALYGELTNDKSAGNLANGEVYINADVVKILNTRPFPFLYKTATAQTTANSQSVVIPARFKKITSVKVTSGTTEWTPQEVPNREFWDRLNYNIATAQTADYPDWWYVQNGEVLLYPTPSTTSTVTITGRVGFTRLNLPAYTTGAVTTATLGSKAIVGTSNTVWTDSMVGRFLRIQANDSPNKGDDEWYEVESVSSNTTLNLRKPYLGTSIVVGTANYIIAQVVPLPDGYQEAPIYGAVSMYYSSKEKDQKRAVMFKGMRDELVAELISDYGGATENVAITDDSVDDTSNPNLYVRL